MSLDTVALIVDTENHFGVTFTNAETEQIFTVQQFIDVLYTKIQRSPGMRCKSQILFYRLREYFQNKLGVDSRSFLPTSTIRLLLANHDPRQTWSTMQNDLHLILPELMPRDIDPNISKEYKILGIALYGRPDPVTYKTVRDFVNWTLAINHKTFIDPQNICSKEELTHIFIGILSESVGIPVHEIKLHHRFTDDLGMD